MRTTTDAAHPAQAKDEFFAADMYMFHVTGFPAAMESAAAVAATG